MFGIVKGFLTYACESSCAARGEIREGLLRVLLMVDDDGCHGFEGSSHHPLNKAAAQLELVQTLNLPMSEASRTARL